MFPDIVCQAFKQYFKEEQKKGRGGVTRSEMISPTGLPLSTLERYVVNRARRMVQRPGGQ